jgi:DNA-binding transcriptional regulator YiaG
MGTRHSQSSKESFARDLVAWRARRGRQRRLGRPISQAEAAVELGLSKRTLQNWEVARTRPNDFVLQVLRGRIGNGR